MLSCSTSLNMSVDSVVLVRLVDHVGPLIMTLHQTQYLVNLLPKVIGSNLMVLN